MTLTTTLIINVAVTIIINIAFNSRFVRSACIAAAATLALVVINPIELLLRCTIQMHPALSSAIDSLHTVVDRSVNDTKSLSASASYIKSSATETLNTVRYFLINSSAYIFNIVVVSALSAAHSAIHCFLSCCRAFAAAVETIVVCICTFIFYAVVPRVLFFILLITVFAGTLSLCDVILSVISVIC